MSKSVNLRYIERLEGGDYDRDEVIRLIFKKLNELIEEYNDLKEILIVKAITTGNSVDVHNDYAIKV